jgi:hypothetical protein
MVRRILLVGAGIGVGVAATAAALAWRCDRRSGSGFVNERINPLLVGRGFAGSGPSEIGTLEHAHQRDAAPDPVHPVILVIARIVVPLATQSHWARNAGRRAVPHPAP